MGHRQGCIPSFLRQSAGPEECAMFNYIGLREVLREELYGQHIAGETIPFLLEQHRLSRNRNAALLLGFHGMSGVGKTLVSRIIAEHLYKRGTKSQFVKTFNFQMVEDPNFYEVIRQFDFSDFIYLSELIILIQRIATESLAIAQEPCC